MRKTRPQLPPGQEKSDHALQAYHSALRELRGNKCIPLLVLVGWFVLVPNPYFNRSRILLAVRTDFSGLLVVDNFADCFA